MSIVNQTYIDALLADAAYANVTQGMDEVQLTEALRTPMTPTLAAYIAANFEVASSINTSDIPLVGSGFDATVWRIRSGSELAGSNNENAGKTYLSMRGTELLPGADVLADGDLTLGSAAASAIIDMVNWWLRETTPTTELARQIKWDPLHQPNPASMEIVPSYVNDTRVAGAGNLVGVTSVQIDGHSLGGHMASAFARLFGAGNSVAGSVNIQSIATFNSAGFNGANSEPLFQRIQALLGTGSSSFAPVSANQTNLFAANGINFTTNDWWFTQMGTRTGLYQEEGVLITLTVGPTEVRLSLVEIGALSADATANLSATYKSVDPADTTSATGNTWAINVHQRGLTGLTNALVKSLGFRFEKVLVAFTFIFTDTLGQRSCPLLAI